nr:hypothetical protein [Corynebacterium jeikeium]
MHEEVEHFRKSLGKIRDEIDPDLYPLTRIFMSSFADRDSDEPICPEDIIRSLIPIISSIEKGM